MKSPFNKKNWLVSQTRWIGRNYPPAIEANIRDKQVYYINSKKGKPMRRIKFTCAICKKINLKRTEVEQDHIIPLVGPEGFIDWNTYFNRYLCDSTNFQYLCFICHDAKTSSEGQVRAKRRQKKLKKIK